MQGKYFINTYGCQMNVHESEKLAGILRSRGYTEAESLNDADIVVFNTCCIRETAEQRVLGNLGIVKNCLKPSPDLKLQCAVVWLRNPARKKRLKKDVLSLI